MRRFPELIKVTVSIEELWESQKHGQLAFPICIKVCCLNCLPLLQRHQSSHICCFPLLQKLSKLWILHLLHLDAWPCSPIKVFSGQRTCLCGLLKLGTSLAERLPRNCRSVLRSGTYAICIKPPSNEKGLTNAFLLCQGLEPGVCPHEQGPDPGRNAVHHDFEGMQLMEVCP